MAPITKGSPRANDRGGTVVPMAGDKQRRKRTYDARKDEIEELAMRAAKLETTLDMLRHRADKKDGSAFSIVSGPRASANTLLREALQGQQHALAGLRSMLSADPTPQALCLVSSPIHLSVDPAQRRDALERLKLEKLHDARRFLDKRAQFTCPVTRFSESSLTTHGTDVSVVKFDVLPLRDAKGVKHAFDAFMYYFANLEIFATEELGDVTVREDDVLGPSKHKHKHKRTTASGGFSTADKSGLGSTSLDSDVVDGFTWADDECLSSSGDRDRDRDSGVAQHRFVRRHDRTTDWPDEQHGRDLLIETNSALFAEYKARLRCPQSGEYREEGVIATDFVDQDELHPYQPRERMRKDVTTVLRFRSCVVAKRDKHATGPVESQSLANPASRDLVGDTEADADVDTLADADTDASTSTSSIDRCGVRERVVVLTMWYRATLRPGELAVSDDARQELVEDMHRVHSAMLRSARTALQYARLST